MMIMMIVGWVVWLIKSHPRYDL